MSTGTGNIPCVPVLRTSQSTANMFHVRGSLVHPDTPRHPLTPTPMPPDTPRHLLRCPLHPSRVGGCSSSSCGASYKRLTCRWLMSTGSYSWSRWVIQLAQVGHTLTPSTSCPLMRPRVPSCPLTPPHAPSGPLMPPHGPHAPVLSASSHTPCPFLPPFTCHKPKPSCWHSPRSHLSLP